MLSRQDDDALAEHCFEEGAQDFLLKDEVTARRLSRAVKHSRQRYLIERALKASLDQLQHLAITDPLTGLANRRGLEIAMEQAIARVHRGHGGLALLLIDLDNFKEVNDTMGHAIGDELLTKITLRLRTAIRDSDILCRMGGDEFVVVLTDLCNHQQAIVLAERILYELQRPIFLADSEKVITSSIGIAILDHCATNTADLLKCADIAMYQAKKAGRNQCQFFSQGLQDALLLQTSMRQDLLKALDANQFRMYYQAQINAENSCLSGMEALLRWQHPTRGLLSPVSFLALAEETTLIVDIGSWVIREVCRQIHQWHQTGLLGGSPITIAINLSAMQVKQPALLAEIKKVLDEYQIPPSSLELEITESSLIDDVHSRASVLSELAECGIKLSLDDFGTGYSSMEHLKVFPITVLKIDRSFVSTIGEDAKGERLLIALINFAKSLGMKVVAEGVETNAQAVFCTTQGCDILQGYHYAKPIPAEQFEQIFLSQLMVNHQLQGSY
mgnify:CR=1 FL=1